MSSTQSPNASDPSPTGHPNTRDTAQPGEAQKLTFLLRLLTGLALAGGVFELVASYRNPEEHTRHGAMIAIIVSLAMFVKWSSLPGLSSRLRAPGMYLSVLSKLVLGMSAGLVPYFCANGHFAAAAGALLFGVASLGLWLGWSWVAWVWYVLLLVAAWPMAESLWSLAGGEEAGILMAFNAIPHLLSFLMWFVFFFELVQWHRKQIRQRPQSPVPSTSTVGGPADDSDETANTPAE